MLAKAYDAIRDVMDSFLDLYRGRTTRGLLVLVVAFACGFAWPLFGVIAAIWCRAAGKYVDIGTVAGAAAGLNVAIYLIQIIVKIALHVL